MSNHVKWLNECNIVLIPCFKRPEYTAKCIKALEEAQDYENTLFYMVDDGSSDETTNILNSAKFKWKHTLQNKDSVGLRNVILNFFILARYFKYMLKVDNDCKVPKNWLDNTIKVLESGNVDIVSPNVIPSNAAFKYGSDDVNNLGFRPSKTVGGLWAMKASLIDDMQFEPHNIDGIKGAFQILNQIIVEKDCRVGWLPQVTVEDIGHWSGEHPEHIQSDEHREYSAMVGRQIAW